MNTDKVKSALNDLIIRKVDSKKRFNLMYNKANRTSLMSWMNKYKEERGQFEQVLRSELELIGGDPESGSYFLGKLHRTYSDMIISSTDDNYEVVLEMCIQGESQLYKDYTEVLENVTLPSTTMSIISAQRDIIGKSLKNSGSIARRCFSIIKDRSILKFINGLH